MTRIDQITTTLQPDGIKMERIKITFSKTNALRSLLEFVFDHFITLVSFHTH